AWAQSLTGGMEQWLAASDLPASVTLTCARGTHRLQMPENILGALFLITKQLGPIVLDQRERRWTRRINPTLGGTTLGILGIGAVKARTIAGGVLDVFRREPLPSDHPFWATDGIVVFPHVGGLHPERDRLVAALFVDNLKRFAAGEPLREVVDRARGY